LVELLPSRRLTLGEAALLVGLPQSPEQPRPDRSSAAARNARDRVLVRVAAAGAVPCLPAAVRRYGARLGGPGRRGGEDALDLRQRGGVEMPIGGRQGVEDVLG